MILLDWPEVWDLEHPPSPVFTELGVQERTNAEGEAVREGSMPYEEGIGIRRLRMLAAHPDEIVMAILGRRRLRV